jgi:TRAP-type C4-dicarboxylate transport system substrate-binding protein
MFKTIATFAIAAMAFASAASAEQLTYGTYFKSTHNIIQDGVKPYFDQVSKKTKDSLTVKLLTDGTVVGASTTATIDELLAAGIVHQADTTEREQRT